MWNHQLLWRNIKLPCPGSYLILADTVLGSFRYHLRTYINPAVLRCPWENGDDLQGKRTLGSDGNSQIPSSKPEPHVRQ
jgi:hypothetical protein